MLDLKNVTLAYGAVPVLEGVDLSVAAGEFVSLVGPSGSGKTSILRAVTGLQKPLAGTVALEVGRDEVGFLFQDDALLPWRTALENVMLGLRIRKLAKREARERASDWLDRLGLAGLGDRYPRELSGGQRKRVAIAQVLALSPRFLLMDEPFASLDAIVRLRITQDLLGWVERERMSVLLVTHDLEEAIQLSDQVFVLSNGPRARIRAGYRVPLQRPRDLLAARRHPAFGDLVDRLWRDLSDEMGPAFREAAE
ncbi:ABC transporter ATP-binding protein [Arenibaculum sp.]|jgi:NitT/TauT family transport system ATP-binding protein|uniref:ABC transporter ATP-binding protein n=1 Tax=Arenibaculum sp. TaxID=2865862 RepID=UPI002E153E7E|nr:ABC transporter ATP-binding protein [Arenibaculum sp.]